MENTVEDIRRERVSRRGEVKDMEQLVECRKGEIEAMKEEKVDSEGDQDLAYPESGTFDQELAEELETLARASHDGYVEVEVDSAMPGDGNSVIVWFDPPIGEKFSREMEIPVDPSMNTEFSKLLEETGQNLDTAKKMADNRTRVPANYNGDGEWEIQYQDEESEEGIGEKIDTAKTFMEEVFGVIAKMVTLAIVTSIFPVGILAFAIAAIVLPVETIPVEVVQFLMKNLPSILILIFFSVIVARSIFP